MESCNCGLCNEFKIKDNVIQEYKEWFLMFNRFPYLPGHVMLVPIRPVGNMSDVTKTERWEMTECIINTQAMILKSLESYGVTSCNVGINIGPDSGGSIPTHLHIHFVPRRPNDTNFMHNCAFSGIGSRRDPITYNGMFETARKEIANHFELKNKDLLM